MAKSKALPHTFTLTVGDPSRDGHNQSDTTAFMSNRTIQEIQKSFGMAAKLHSLDITRQCQEYEDSRVDEDYWTRARAAFHNVPEVLGLSCLSDEDEVGYDEDCAYVSSDEFMELYLQTAKLVDPELEWTEAPTGSDHFIGGYGLFY
jgi:hypothetical protein